MRFRTILSLISVLFCQSILAQTNNYTVTGTVTNILNKALPNATVAISKPNSKNSIEKVKTDLKGNFSVSLNTIDKYKLNIQFLGYKPFFKDITFTKSNHKLILDTIRLLINEQLLDEVIVYGKLNQMLLKGDTIEYNAKAFNLRNGDVVGNLINKINGFNLQNNGLLYNNGELITNITVNGKDFFKGEPLMALNNLPAEITSKLQVISNNKGSVNTKTLNIVTDKDKTQGAFGTQSAGAGTKDTKRLELNLNRFKKDMQLSVLANYGNIPNQEYFNFLEQGITLNRQAALNYSNTIKNHHINVSYIYEKSAQNLEQTVQTTTFYNNINNINNTSFANADNRTTNRLNFNYDTKINKTLLLKIQANRTTADFTTLSLQSYSSKRNDEEFKGTQNSLRDGSTPNVDANIQLIKSFNQNKRNLQLNYIFSNAKRGNESFNIRNQNAINNSQQIENINQLLSSNDTLKTNTLSLSYFENVSQKSKLILKSILIFSNRISQRETFDYDTLAKAYSILNPTYSSNINDRTKINRNSLSYDFNTSRIEVITALTAEIIDQRNDYINQTFVNFLPSIQFQVKINAKNRVNFSYYQTTNIPELNQIMPGGDNMDNNTVFVGNSNLKPSKTQSLNFTHNYFNPKTTQVIFTSLKLDQTHNAIVPSYKYDELTNRNIIEFVNASSTRNAMLNSLYSFPLSSDKLLMLNIGITGLLNSLSNISDNKETRTNNLSIDNNYRLNANFKIIELIFNTSVSFNTISYKFSNQKKQEYYLINNNLSASAYLNPNLKTSIMIDYRKTIGDNFLKDVDIVPINLAISQQFLKSKKATISFKANDLLNQNKGVIRTLTESSISDRNFNVLGRYFFLSLSYKISQFKGD